MNKKTKVLIGFLLIIILIGLIFGISTIVRFCKLQSILNKVNENVEKNNYYMKTTITNKGITQITETYYKEGVGKFISADDTYIWFDGTNAYSIDEEKQVAIILNSNEVIGVINNESFASLYPGYTDSFLERLMLAGDFSNKFKTDYHNGKKCTIITIKGDEYTKTFWITKDMQNLVKAEINFSNGDNFEYKYDLMFHSTQTRDIKLPDISEYKVIEASTGESIETNILDNNIKLDVQNVVVENIITDTSSVPIG